MPDLSFDETQDLVLYVLYRVGRDIGKIVIGGGEPASSLEFRIPGANDLWCERAFDALVEAGHVLKESASPTLSTAISISGSGISLVETRLGLDWSSTSTVAKTHHVERSNVFRTGSFSTGHILQLSLVANAEAEVGLGAIDVPASDRIVSLDHNSPQNRQALQDLEQLIDEVRESNETVGTAEEKERVVAELSAARKLLDASKVRARQVLELAKPALTWVAENFSKESIKELAKSFGAWLFKWLVS